MTKKIEIVTISEKMEYFVEKETKENVFLVEKYLNKKARYSIKNNRMEYMVAGKWVVVVDSEEIVDVRTYEDDVLVDIFVEGPVSEDVSPDRITGNQIIEIVAAKIEAPIKKTRKGELWIPMTEEQFYAALSYLATDESLKHMHWETKRGSLKSHIWDEDNGTDLIFKKHKEDGTGAYLWCIKD